MGDKALKGDACHPPFEGFNNSFWQNKSDSVFTYIFVVEADINEDERLKIQNILCEGSEKVEL